MTQCDKVRKGYVVEGDRIYNGYICQKDKGHKGKHEFYHDELNLPIFKKLHDAHLYKNHLDKKGSQSFTSVEADKK